MFQFVAGTLAAVQHRSGLDGQRIVDAFAATPGLPVLEAEDFGLLELDLPGEAATCEAAGLEALSQTPAKGILAGVCQLWPAS